MRDILFFGSLLFILLSSGLVVMHYRRALQALEAKVAQQQGEAAETREDMARYRALFDLSPMACVVWEPAGFQVVKWNREAERLFGWSRDEMLDRNMLETLSPETGKGGSGMGTISLLLGGLPKHAVYSFKTRDGGRVVCDWHSIALRSEGGGTPRVLSVGVDITRRKELERDNFLLRSLIEFTAEPAIFVIDPHNGFRFSYVNYAVCRHFGRGREEVMGWRLSDYDQQASPSSLDGMWQELKKQKTLHFETKHLLPSGERVPVEVVFNLFNHEGVELIGGYFRDIRERKARETRERQYALETVRRESDQRYRELFENSSDVIFMLDVTEEGRFRLAGLNPAAERVLDLPGDVVNGEFIEDVLPHEAAAPACERYRQCVADGVPVSYEESMPLRRGLHHFSTTLIPVRNDDGKVSRLVVMARDITEHKQFEEMQRMMYERLEKIAVTAPGVVVVFQRRADGGFCLPYAAPGIVDICGFPPEALMEDASCAMERVHPEDVDKVWRTMGVSATTLSVWQCEFRMCHPEGGEIWVEGRAAPEEQEDGSILWYGFVHDITARKQTEQRLHAREQEFRTLVEHTPDVVVRYGLDFRRLYVNPAWELANGVSKEAATGKTPEECAAIVAPYAKEFQARLQAVMDSGQPAEIEFDGYDAHGQEHFFAMRAVPEFDADGRVASVLSVSRDITEYKRLENGLVALEQHFRNLAENSPDNIIRYDRQGRAIYLNPAMESLFGSDVAAGTIGKTPLEAFPAEPYIQHYEEALRRVLATGELEELEIVSSNPDGTLGTYHIRFAPERGEGGEITGALAFGRDITARKEVENLLREERGLFVGGPTVVFKWKAEAGWPVAYVSPNVAEQFGYAPGDFTSGKVIFASIVHPDDIVRVGDEVAAYTAQGRASYEQVYRIAHGNGGYRWIYDFTIVTRREDGAVAHYHGYVMDITEQKLAENALRESERRLEKSEGLLRTTLRTIPDLIWLKDTDGVYLSCNHAFERYFGAAEADIIGKTDFDFVDVELASFFRENDRMAIEADEVRVNEEWVTYPDGSKACLETRKVPLPGANGQVIGVLGIGRDITERKMREAALQRRLALEAQIASVAQAVPGFLYTTHIDVNGNSTFPFASEGIKELLGLTPEDIRNDPASLRARYHPDDLPAFLAHVRESCATLKPFRHEIRVLHPERGLRWIDNRCTPTRLPDGSVEAHGLMIDVTERKRMESALKASEASYRSNSTLLRAVLESSPEIIVFALDREFCYLAFNEKHRETMRTIWGRDIAVGESMLDVIGSQADRDKARRDFERALAGESFVSEDAYGDEALMRSYWQIYWAPIRDHNGGVIGVTCFVLNVTERKLAEQHLEEALEFTSGIINAMPDILFEVNREGRYLNVWTQNPQVRQAQVAALVGKTFHDMLSPENAAAALEAVREADVNGAAYGKEIAVVQPDGEVRWYEHSLSKKRGRTEADASFIVLSRDVTERKQQEMALRERESFMLSLLDTIPVPVFFKDRRGAYLGFNKAYEEFFGAEKSQLVGKTAFDIAPRELAEIYHAKDEALYAEGGVQCYESRVKNARGCLREVIFHKAVFIDAHGKPGGLIGAVQDITERKRMEQSLAEQEREFRSLAENVPDNIARWDCQGRYLYVNPTHERTLGVSAQEIIGKEISAIHDQVKAAIAEVAANGKATVCVRQTVLAPNGEKRFHDVSIVPERNSEGKIVSVLGIGRDMTDIYRMQEALAAREQEFRSLAESSPDYIVRYDREGRCLYFNGSLLSLLGIAHMEETLGKRPCEIWPDGRFDNIEQAAAKAVESGEAITIELAMSLPSGETIYNQIHVVPERDVAGQIVGSIVFGTDITGLKRLELGLRQQKDFQETLLNAMNDVGIQLMVIENGRIIHASNRKIAGEFGYSDADIAARPALLDIIHPDDRAWVMDSHQRRVAGENIPTSYEVGLVTRNGERREYEVSAAVVPGTEPVRIISVGRDITGRKRMEQMLQTREIEYRTLADNMPANVSRYDREGRRTYLNRHLEDLLALNREQLLGKTVRESCSPVMRLAFEHYAASLEHVLSTGEDMEIEIPVVLPGGKEHTHHVYFRAERDPAGDVIGALSIGWDISEFKDEERRHVESHAQMQRLAALRGEALRQTRLRLAREMHEDVAQMAAAMNMQACALSIRAETAAPTLVKHIADMVNLSGRLLEKSRQVAHSVRPVALDMGIGAALEWLVDSFRETSGVSCELHLEDEGIRLDEGRAMMVFNIAQQALDYIERFALATQVEVVMKQREEEYILELTDDGQGFEPDMFQESALGLVDIQEQAHALGGEATLYSVLSRGSVLEVRFPVEEVASCES